MRRIEHGSDAGQCDVFRIDWLATAKRVHLLARVRQVASGIASRIAIRCFDLFESPHVLLSFVGGITHFA